jgi:hypothetical protein
METVPLTAKRTAPLSQLEMDPPEQYDGRFALSHVERLKEGMTRVPESIAAGDATWVLHFRFVQKSLECSETPAFSESQKIKLTVWRSYGIRTGDCRRNYTR